MPAPTPIDELSSQGAVDWWTPVRPANAKRGFAAQLPVSDRVGVRVALGAVDPTPGGASLSLTLTFERK